MSAPICAMSRDQCEGAVGPHWFGVELLDGHCYCDKHASSLRFWFGALMNEAAPKQEQP